ncbi:MAG: type II toxin-antitoxin system VapC family toxin [Bacteriovoracaceae bacterium]|nr:type II toxin-antitoxin system VapC family toxin [Bacteriovoracaceae bacterium]
MKLKLVILDANVIIDLYRNGIWEKLISRYEVYVPSVVIRDEVIYFIGRDQQKKELNIRDDVKNGKIKIIAAKMDDYLRLKQKVIDDYYESLDPGELEAIALLYSGEYEDYKFCTGDKAAIRALTIFDLTFQGISLEKLLQDASIKFAGFAKNYSEQEFKKQQGLALQEKDLFLK